MAHDSDWVTEVRRWVFAAAQAKPAAPAGGFDADEIGYEAANPSLQSPDWSETLPGAFIEMK